MLILLFLIIGILVGILSSMFGFGGGIVIVPVLYWLLPQQSVPAKYVMIVSVATSLAIMIINSANSTYSHHKRGNVTWDVFLKLAPFISIGALFGAFATDLIGGDVVRYMFVGFLVYIILMSIYKRSFVQPISGDFILPNNSRLGAAGTFIGFFAVMLGIGGSVITVPFLRKCNMKMVNAVALAVPLGLPIALVGAISYIYLGYGQEGLPAGCIGFVYIPALIGIASGGFIGVPLGTFLTAKLPDHLFSKIYLALLFLVVISMLFKL
jgi:uncharacterized protein